MKKLISIPSSLAVIAIILAGAAMVISIVALLAAYGSEEGYLHLVDRGEFTADLVMDALAGCGRTGLRAA